MSEQQQQPATLSLCCLQCSRTKFIKKPTTYQAQLQYEGSRVSSITCKGLKRHLNNPEKAKCLELYNRKKLLKLSPRDQTIIVGFSLAAASIADISTSIQQWQCNSSNGKRGITNQLGFTMTSDCPASSVLQKKMRRADDGEDFNSVLDKQVSFNAYQPQIHRKLIDYILSQKNNPYLADNTDDDEDIDTFLNNSDGEDSVEDDDVSEEAVNPVSVLNNRHSKWLDTPYLPPRRQLVAEIDLMSIMVRHKMPLCAFTSLCEWGSKNQVNKLDHSISGEYAVGILF